MKRILLITVALAMVSLVTLAQNVNIPDANFKAYLVGNTSINTSGDTEIQVSEASAFTGTISCNSQSISDLTGIEAFVNLTKLRCEFNNLSSLNLNQNTALTEVYLSVNSLTSLDVSQCTALTHLKFQSNNISSIDLTNNTALVELYCNYNSLTTIDLTQNTALTFLAFNGNLFTTIDLSQNTALETLFSGENPNLTSLDLSNNTSLKTLTGNYVNPGNLSTLTLGQNSNLNIVACDNCGLTSLDVSQNPNITFLGIAGNSINTIDLSANTALTNINLNYNSLTALNLSSNTNLSSIQCANNFNLSALNLKNLSTSANIFATSNPNLTCIEVDDVTAAETNWTNIDAGASFSLKCTVDIPDPNFKAYLVGESAINTNGDTEIQVTEAAAFTGEIDCAELGILDLTGIEAFTALTQLNCEENGLTSLDLSQNIELTHLNCDYNSLSTLDLSQNTALIELRCTETNLSSLDLSHNTLLTSLICPDNNLTALDVTNNPLLSELNCVSNSISTLDLSQNTALETFYCNENTPLTVLNMKNISTSVLTDFYAEDNPNLVCIQVDDAAAASAAWTNIDATASFSTNCNYLVSSISVQGQSSVSTITISGGTLQMEATVLPAFASDDTYTWSVTNGTGEATIDASGLLTAVSNGTVTVTATANDGSGVTGDAEITISNQIVLVSSITVQGESGAATITTSGGTLQMVATVLPANADDATYTWSVANGTGGATISTSGLLTAVSNGTVTVTATANDDSEITGEAIITISNQIVLVSAISVQGQAGATTITTNGGTLQMEATVSPTNATDATYTWSVANGTGDATIDANGLLTAVSDGTVTVTATANDGSGVTGDAEITISNQIVLVSSITVQGESGAATITTSGGTLQMVATVLPATADGATYTWGVTNGTGEATIDASGLLTAVSNGIVTVTATANDGSGVTGDAVITISNQVILSANDQRKLHDLFIYPNPASSVLTFASIQTIEAVTIVDFTGKSIKTVFLPKKNLDVSSLPAGIYFLQIKTNQGLVSKKFVKQ